MKTIRAVALCVLAVCLLAVGRADHGADIHIVFSGLICHVFDDEHAPRAVAMRGSAGMEHHATLHLQRAAIVSSDVPLACDTDDCTLDLTNTALRFAPGSGRAHYDRGGSFDTIVPHLRAVTNGEMAALRGEVFDDVPSAASPVSASMILPDGMLTAVAYPTTARYEPDFEARGERRFAREVTLDGQVATSQLLVRRANDDNWQRITFRRGQLIEMRLVNEPASMATATSHYLLYHDLAAVPLASRPHLVFGSEQIHRHGADSATDVECGNTNWP